MVEQINTWIENGSPYQEGVQLYAQYGSDSFLKMLFGRQENSFNKSRLSRELLQLLEWAQEPGPMEKVILEVLAAPTQDRSGRAIGRTYDHVYVDHDYDPEIGQRTAAGLPDLLQASRRIEQNYAELRGLHPYLKTTPPGERLHQIAQRIVILGKKNAELWSEKNRLLEDPDASLQEQPEPVQPVMIDLNLLNRRELIRKSLNKAQNRLKKQGIPSSKTRKLMEQREQELRDIDQEIARAKEKGTADA